jgi:MerR family redox-sensitive transcriptional activator SoxR
MSDATLTIGQVARQAGVNASAIRYYERIGLLPIAERHGGQRRYAPEVVRRLEAIDVAKQAGFTLAETRALLAADAERAAHAELRALAARKLSQVDALIARAQAMRGWLAAAQRCTCETLDDCGLFDVDVLAAAGGDARVPPGGPASAIEASAASWS